MRYHANIILVATVMKNHVIDYSQQRHIVKGIEIEIISASTSWVCVCGEGGCLGGGVNLVTNKGMTRGTECNGMCDWSQACLLAAACSIFQNRQFSNASVRFVHRECFTFPKATFSRPSEKNTLVTTIPITSEIASGTYRYGSVFQKLSTVAKQHELAMSVQRSRTFQYFLKPSSHLDT